MVERVAKALWEQYSVSMHPWSEAKPYEREKLHADARAAIAVMREPSEAMLLTAAKLGTLSSHGAPYETWQEMIDEALR